MQKGRKFHWQQLFILGCLSMLFAPGWSQEEIKPEKILNDVALDASCVEVLNRRGMPHFIGPSVSGVSSITSLLRPIEQRGIAAGSAMPGNPNAQGPRPPAPAPYGTNAGTQALPAPPKKENIFMVWRYDGNGKTPDPKASFSTYVFLNDVGIVEAVVVYLNNPQASPSIQTETGITFGTRLSDIVKVYNWPEPFTRVGSMYYCSYPAKSVTFALDATTRKVTCISIGVPLVVTAQSLVPGESATAGAATGRPALVVPQVPGGMYQPPRDTPPGGYQPGGGMNDGDVPASNLPGGGGGYPGMQPPPPMPPG